MFLSVFFLRHWRSTLLVGTLLAPAGLRAQSTTCMLVPVALSQRVQAATLVVEARVRSQQTEWAAGGHLVVRNELEVFKVFRGQLPAGPLHVLTLGGTLGLRRETVTGTLQLRADQQGIFLLEADLDHPGELRACAGPQGFIAYNLASLTASEPFGRYGSIAQVLYPAVAAASAPYQEVQPNPGLRAATAHQAASRQTAAALSVQAPTISSFSPASLTAGTSTSTSNPTVALTITGTGFGAVQGSGYVQFRSADDPGPNAAPNYTQPLASEYLSWSDTEIRVRVPSNSATGETAGTGFFQVVATGGALATSPSALTVTYSLTNVDKNGQNFRIHLISPDGSGGYTLRYSPSFPAVAQAPFERALKGWHCQTSMNRTIGASTTIDAANPDDVNVVRFGSLPDGVLGVTYSYYSGCSVNSGPLNWQVTETDYVFTPVPIAATPTTPAYTWNFASTAPSTTQYDFESVALHEQGHGEQLGHIISATGVMNYAIGNGATSRTLDANTDLPAGKDVISYSTNSSSIERCSIAPFVASTSGCTLPVVLTAFAAHYVPSQGTHLSWTTASEQQSAAFIIESQDDGAAWQDVARVAAAGSSPTPRPYANLDPRPLAGTRYYRLRQLDRDGTTTYSPIISVAAAAGALAAYPNPATGTVQLVGPALAAGSARVRLLDAAGRCVRQQALPPGQGSAALPLAGVPAGWYIVEWGGDAATFRTRLVVN